MKGVGLRLAAVVLGGALAFLVIEVGLRVGGVWVGRHTDTMFSLVEHDAVLGWRLKRGMHASVDLVDVEGIPVDTNSLGFWDREWDVERNESVCRVLFLGDSFTWGMGVRRGERFSEVVADAAGWESLNFGVPGYGVDQSVLVWEKEAARFRPDVVVLTIYQNDYRDDVHLVRYGRRKPFFVRAADGSLALAGVPVEAVTFWEDGVFNALAEPYATDFGEPIERRSTAAHWLVKNSDVVRALYTLTRGGPRAVEATDEAGPSAGTTSAALTPIEATEVSLLGALVARLRQEVEGAHGRLLVVLAGSASPLHTAAAAQLSSAGIAVVDATTGQISPRVRGASIYFPYSGHWTEASHRAAGDMIVEAIRREDWCARSR